MCSLLLPSARRPSCSSSTAYKVEVHVVCGLCLQRNKGTIFEAFSSGNRYRLLTQIVDSGNTLNIHGVEFCQVLFDLLFGPFGISAEDEIVSWQLRRGTTDKRQWHLWKPNWESERHLEFLV